MEHTLTDGVHISEDAAIVLALAESAAPFAMSVEEEVERWLRVMRLHGRAGAALQGIGVGEALLEERAGATRPRPEWLPRADRVVAAVRERAGAIAAERGTTLATTTDVLAAVIDVYGEPFDSALIACGSTREELTNRLT
jgi:imidazolonepropionase-like amidohydrolase